jgi:hypothetical protein
MYQFQNFLSLKHVSNIKLKCKYSVNYFSKLSNDEMLEIWKKYVSILAIIRKNGLENIFS